MTDLRQAEFEALRATIRERGTLRMCALLLGLAVWGALALTLALGGLQGGVALVPFLVLAATFEVSFFIHTGIERIGRYLQVFYEDASEFRGWETTAMQYGARFPGGLDPLFATLFSAATLVNFFGVIAAATRRPGWIALFLAAHLTVAYRIVTAHRRGVAQRSADLTRFRELRETPKAE